MKYLRLVVFVLAVGALAYALIGLRDGEDGVSPRAVSIGVIPATIFAPPQGPAKAIVIVAHGFAGSQQMMAPIATTLARDGYLAITFDFAGHGRDTLPLHGGVVDLARSTNQLLDQLDEVATYARALPEFNGKLALVGHSMASELVVQSAMRRKDIDATVAISLFGRAVTATSPRDLLVIDGAWEFGALKDAARRIVGLTAPDPQEGVTYGDFANGTARSYEYAAGAEHIGVIWSLDALKQTRAWLDAAFAAKPTGAGVDRRGPWFAVLLVALAVLLRLGIDALPPIVESPPRAPLSRGRFYALISAAAVATPLLLWKAPTDFLPILLGDYLATHFVVWGALLWVGALWLGGTSPSPLPLRERVGVRGAAVSTPPSLTLPRRGGRNALRILLSAAILAALYLILFGLPLDLFVTSFRPTGLRWAIVPVEIAAVALAFTAEERLARGVGAPRFAYTLIKLAFVVSLLGAVALNLSKLFFLLIVAPVVVVLFVFFGFLNRAAFARTRAGAVGALGAAVALGYAIAVTFPMVD
jgi:dienelactone hydrolase